MTTFSLTKVRVSANAHMTPVAIRQCSSSVRGTPARTLSCKLRTLTKHKTALPSLTCQASADYMPLSSEVTKSSLRKSIKAQLVSHAQQMGVEDSGTKHVLVDRLHALVSTDLAAQSQVADGRQEEVQKLQAEVAELDLKLVAVNEILADASVAREEERQQLANVIAAMSSMREKWQTDVQQVEELAAVAGHLEQSERDILSLRSQQGRFEERIAMMQHLVEEREQEVLTLQAQLAQFRQPVLALAGATSAGYGATTWDSDTALATEPLRTSSFSNASWANDWNTAVVRSNESSAAATDRSAVDMLPPVASAATVRASMNRDHTTPGLAIVAAVSAAAQKGEAAWDSVKSLLPQDTRVIADAVLAAGATALLYSMYT